MHYTIKTLYEYCETNGIILTQDYKNKEIKRDNYIEGKCIINNCNDSFNKTFRQLVKTGGYCCGCMKDIVSNKIKTKLIKFTNKLLNEFCDENKIQLLNDYTNIQINEKTIIDALCLTSDCENRFSKSFRELIHLNGYCSVCSKEKGKIKIRETNMEKYGVECCLLSEEIKQKTKKTNMKKYGVEFVLQNENIQKKMRNKNLKKYGFEHILQAPEFREKIEKTNLEKYGAKTPFLNDKIKEQIESTNILKYGNKNYFATDEFKTRITQYNLEKYGVENLLQNSEIREKIKQTNLQKYGYECGLQNSEIKEKIKQTNLQKYRYEHPSQNSIIAEKMLKSSYNRKQYMMPSGKIIIYQGYENFAFDELINIEKIDEDDIITNRIDVPELWYYDRFGIKRRHYVDIYIKSQNRCIEVKSLWTANIANNNVLEKQKGALSNENGYKYEIWIYDNKGNKIK